MKCRSVACLWSGAPPSHRVTATASLTNPPTLYTGGSDGSIIWWSISSSSESNSEVKPIAMLCGHTAPIVDLAVCDPTTVSGNGVTADCSDTSNMDPFVKCSVWISVCTDGVLCVWSTSCGNCRRRRKLPPWVGSSSILCTLPSEPRYVCVDFSMGIYLLAI
ncbi:WD40 repeat [Arabidopsis suecica]|uniref:WD40 repeat n=1 Tax=Arabidopsis suecica TaxID=45249 RepID=A0A8T1ZGX0_ARASU|nr:WD40 repeat [Arabidopsis suecica]